jgi:hypothetical protein
VFSSSGISGRASVRELLRSLVSTRQTNGCEIQEVGARKGRSYAVPFSVPEPDRHVRFARPVLRRSEARAPNLLFGKAS